MFQEERKSAFIDAAKSFASVIEHALFTHIYVH